MIRPFGRSESSRISILSLFFAVFFSACAYFYFQYRQTRFNTVDFEKLVLYTGDDIFMPSSDEYVLYFYSSKSRGHLEFLKNLPLSQARPIVAIDINQYEESNAKDGLIFVKTGINTLLKYIHLFKISELPALVSIDRKSIHVYRQSAKVQFIPVLMLE